MIRIIITVFASLVLVSCGGTQRGTIAEYTIDLEKGELANRVNDLSALGKLNIVCSPSEPCESTYENDFVLSMQHEGDSVWFKFITLPTESESKTRIRLLSGSGPEKHLKQKGTMSFLERRRAKTNFSAAFIPYLET